MVELVRRAAAAIAATVVVLGGLLALHLVTAPFPQWPLWLCVILGGVFLVAMVAAQVSPPGQSDDDDTEA